MTPLKMTLQEESERVFDTLEDFMNETPNFNIFKASKDGTMQANTGDRLNLKKDVEYCFNTDNPPIPILKKVKKGFSDYYNPYKGQNLDGKVLGCWRSGGIGDLLFIRPILMHLKKLYPTCKIYFATRERYHGMIKNWTDCLDGVENYPFPVNFMIKRADYHMTFQGAIESCKESNDENVYDIFARLAGLDPEDIDFNVPMDLPTTNPIIDLLRGSVVVQTTTSSHVRTPAMRTFLKAINHITAKGLNVVISDGPNNAKRTDHLISCCDSPSMVHNLASYTKSLIDAINLVDSAPLVVAPDSSHAHFAGCQGTPLVALYGPFPGRVRTTHYENCRTIETPEVKACCQYGGRECFLHNANNCQFNERCWLNLDDNAVLEAIDELLE